MRVVCDVCGVIVQKLLKKDIQVRIGRRDAVRQQAFYDHRAGTVTDHRGDCVQSDRREIGIGQHMVQRFQQIGRRVHKRTIQVEDYCPSVEGF